MRSAIACLLLLLPLAASGDEPDPIRSLLGVEEPLTFEDIFRRAAVHDVALSPNGEFVAYFRDDMLVIGTHDTGYSDVRKFNDRLWIEEIVWIGPRTVWVESWDGQNSRHLGTAVRFKTLEEGGYGVDEAWDHRNPGYISDPLVQDDYHIVLARPDYDDETLTADLYRVNVFDYFKGQLKRDNRIDTGPERFFYYAQNSAGEFKMGIRIAEGVPEIWRKQPDSQGWELVWTADKESTFLPWKMSEDGKTLWGLSDAQSDRIVATEFDIESSEFGDILFEHDRVDVEAILMSDDDTVPIGVIYTEQGLLRYHFFSEEYAAEFERIQAHFPGQGIALIGHSAESNTRLVFASSPTDRGSIHICDLTNYQCQLVESIAPWLEGKKLSETVALDIESTDDVVVEAFLTLPRFGQGEIPLVAMPHGGPIGVSDDRYFSKDAQWLALNGYAVLQVNYRGSGGYGDNFVKAGLRQWGRGIEDDIEAAVRRAIADYPQIDGDRVGIFGGSYGGYSAVMSVIRNPALFKCAASFAGVMDLTLMFTESAKMRNEYLRKTLIEYVGDPDVDYEEQIEHSPVYRYKDITRPVLLAHGLDDEVVDYEHSWRMQKMMRLNGSIPEFLLLKKVGHGFDYINEAQEFYDPLVEFLDEHLKPEAN